MTARRKTLIALTIAGPVLGLATTAAWIEIHARSAMQQAIASDPAAFEGNISGTLVPLVVGIGSGILTALGLAFDLGCFPSPESPDAKTERR